MTSERTMPSVSIIGSGRLGTALSLGLRDAGYSILSVVAEHAASAEKAANLIGHSVVRLTTSELSKLPLSDIFILSTPDDALEAAARKLSTEGPEANGAVVLHTSGALSSKVLSPLADAGWHTGSLHPLVSVSEPLQGARNLQGAFFCIEGDETAREAAASIVRNLGGQSFSVDSDRKALYHAAAVTTAGHVVALFDVAVEMLVKAGLDNQTAQRVLFPLIKSAVGNLEKSAPEHALTGTFSRGDESTVRHHLKAIEEADLPTAIALYRLLGLRSITLAERRGLDSETVATIKQMLMTVDQTATIKG